jgi:c(7)-type cytochrome triheme protein
MIHFAYRVNFKRMIIEFIIALIAGVSGVQAAPDLQDGSKAAAHWSPLYKDELHDPLMPALKQMQKPENFLSKLPRDGAGNQVNWSLAIERGYINPQDSIRTNTKIKVLDLDVLRRNTGEMDIVLFPHKQHTEWLTCSDCHEELFRSKAGATKFGMFDILKGEYCGRCHGAVAFPLTDCKRCHSVPRPPLVVPAQTK